MNAYQEWEVEHPHVAMSMFHLAMTPNEQRMYRKRIVEGCIGIEDCWVWAGAKTADHTCIAISYLYSYSYALTYCIQRFSYRFAKPGREMAITCENYYGQTLSRALPRVTHGSQSPICSVYKSLISRSTSHLESRD